MDVELQLTSLSNLFKSHSSSWVVVYFLCGNDTIYELAFKSILRMLLIIIAILLIEIAHTGSEISDIHFRGQVYLVLM